MQLLLIPYCILSPNLIVSCCARDRAQAAGPRHCGTVGARRAERSCPAWSCVAPDHRPACLGPQSPPSPRDRPSSPALAAQGSPGEVLPVRTPVGALMPEADLAPRCLCRSAHPRLESSVVVRACAWRVWRLAPAVQGRRRRQRAAPSSWYSRLAAARAHRRRVRPRPGRHSSDQAPGEARRVRRASRRSEA